MRLAARLMLAGCALSAAGASRGVELHSDVHIRIEPPAPTSRSAIDVVLDSTACTPYLIDTVTRSGSTIDVVILDDDWCDYDLPPVHQRVAIGALPPGGYLVRYVVCTPVPSPLDPPLSCGPAVTEHFTVTQHRKRQIPTLAWPALATAALATLLLAFHHFLHKPPRA